MDELQKFKEHSILLNRVMWQMLDRLGELKEGQIEDDVDLELTVDKFFHMYENHA
jgi:hypothetical protein